MLVTVSPHCDTKALTNGTRTQQDQHHVPTTPDRISPDSANTDFGTTNSSRDFPWIRCVNAGRNTFTYRDCASELPENSNGSWRSARQSPTSPARKAEIVGNDQQAKARLDRYNLRWQQLAPAQTPVPFPIRNLYDQRELPLLSVNWTDHAAGCANVKRLFLQAFGMSLGFRSSNAAIIMCLIGADKGKLASLIKQLKKEHLRWHPDRLGRRNNEREGTNQVLLDDYRAKIMFIAVTELLAGCQRAIDVLRAGSTGELSC